MFSRIPSRATSLLVRLSSTLATSTIPIKLTPSKDHLHVPVPDSDLPKGYLLIGIHAGVKKPKPTNPTPLDLALVLSTSPYPTSVAACFTLNAFRAAPVLVSREVIQESGGRAHAFVVNSGCANAATGKKGIQHAWEMVKAGDPASVAGLVHHSAAVPAPSPGSPPTAGLHATLLGLILTDAPVSPQSLQPAPTYAVERSFNSISIDGDMSTNDTIILLENGAGHDASGSNPIEIDEFTDLQAYVAFRDHLTDFSIDLAKLVVRDGEGATKFVGICVENAASCTDAHRVASTISTLALGKTALYGEDANRGRILSSTGSTPLSTPLDPNLVSVSFVPPSTASNVTPLVVLKHGEPVGVDEARSSEILKEEDFEIRVDLGGQFVVRFEAWVEVEFRTGLGRSSLSPLSGVVGGDTRSTVTRLLKEASWWRGREHTAFFGTSRWQWVAARIQPTCQLDLMPTEIIDVDEWDVFCTGVRHCIRIDVPPTPRKKRSRKRKSLDVIDLASSYPEDGPSNPSTIPQGTSF
ncbi:ArgJ-like domain-containing protein [Boletus reticuloceps]|uniref:Arginine biosynthesis bifunctional protein ArgJ, mitochondrial n=1 Tax=Boletus reticuloceps TaxID=495285 RepID=A0A8I3A4J7_9AGAM|nr:ArgJ-like domain-containing protein [Boletus reticuloceps]